MPVGTASRHPESQPSHDLLFRRRCTRRFSALFERLRKQINRLEREIERLRRHLNEEKKKSADAEKKIAELERENSKLKRDLEAKAPQADKLGSLSTPSAMQPAYSKPSGPKRRRKPGRKKGHPGTCRPPPAKIDQHVEHTLSDCPKCGSTKL